MPFTVEDFQDLLRLLEQQPQWKSALRASLLGEEFLQLPALVRELAEAQRRTQEAVRALADAQARTQQELRTLAEAQARTQQEVRTLAEELRTLAEAQARTQQELRALAEAQARTQQELQDLAEAQRRTEQQVWQLAEAQRMANVRLGRLEDALGLTIEEHAEDILRLVLREKGLEILEEPRSLPVDGEGQIDLAAVCRDPQGRRVAVVVESKARLTVSAVRRWADRIGSADFRARLHERGLPGPYLAYAFGIRADRAVEEAARQAGVGLLGSRGEVVPPSGLLE